MKSKSRSSEDLIRLKDRALSATAEGITIVDARLPDRPLIYVNAGFERLTGYPRESVLGRNCRFLQGAGTDADTVSEVRDAIAAARECTVEILNYRKDGTPFWNRLSITPVEDGAGNVTHFIGVQSDVSNRRRAEDELRRTTRELEVALEGLRQDLDLASKVQKSFLPEAAPAVDGLEVAWEFVPCAHLAGDFVNVFALDDERVALYVIDVSGHGTPAALLSVTLSRWLSPTPADSCLFRPRENGEGGYRIARPSEVAGFLNDRYQLDPDLAQYFTMIYGVLDVPGRRFEYVAAGHPGPVHVPAGGKPVAHGSTATPVGLLPKVVFEEATLELDPGDRIYLYTDGVTEAVNANDEELGQSRLCESLEASRGVSLSESLRGALARMKQWQDGGANADDVTLLAAEVQ